jgi:hypothetical protein
MTVVELVKRAVDRMGRSYLLPPRKRVKPVSLPKARKTDEGSPPRRLQTMTVPWERLDREARRERQHRYPEPSEDTDD